MQYCGGFSALWGVSSVFGSVISIMEENHQHREGIPSVLWKVFSTMEDTISTVEIIPKMLLFASKFMNIFNIVDGISPHY